MSALPAIVDEVTARLHSLAPTRSLIGLTDAQGRPLQSKSAAQGAALIANGLAGGRYQTLVDGMRLREAHGTVLDYLYVRGAAQLRERFVGGERSGCRSRNHCRDIACNISTMVSTATTLDNDYWLGISTGPPTFNTLPMPGERCANCATVRD